MQCGAQAEASKLGVTLRTQGPQKFDPTLQTPIVDSVVSSKPDAIMIAPTDVTAMQKPLAVATQSGIKLVLVDTTLSDPSIAASAIASDNEGGGKAAFEAIKALAPQGGKVLVMSVDPGISTTDARAKGFQEAVQADPKFKYLGVQYSHDDPPTASNLISSALQKDPDLVGVFAANLFAAEGTATGVKQAGKQNQVKIVGFDAGPNQVKAQGRHRPSPGRAGARRHRAVRRRRGRRVSGGRPGDPEGSDRIHRHHQGQRRRCCRWRGLQIQLLDTSVRGAGFLPAPRAPATSAIPNAIIGAAAKASSNHRSAVNEAAFGQSLPSPEIITLGAGRKPR